MEVLNNFGSIYCFITFVLGAMFMFTILCIAAMCKTQEPKNNVHFYVARDKTYNLLWLYLCKPIRFKDDAWLPWKHGTVIETESSFGILGLNKEDYNSLKWEDEPIEVFLNLND